MNLPNQSAPVVRDEMTIKTALEGITASDCCGAGKHCVGYCIPFVDICAGVCV
jgi:hypothetical protein